MAKRPGRGHFWTWQTWESLGMFAFPQARGHAAFLCLVHPAAKRGNAAFLSPTMEKYLVTVNQGFGPALPH